MAASRSRKSHHKRRHANSRFDFDLFYKIVRSMLFVFCGVSVIFGLFYFYPVFLAACTDTLPRLWLALQTWITPPVLFVLVNLVVGAVVVTSGFVQHAKKNNTFVVQEDFEGEEEEEDEVKRKPSSAADVKNRSEEKPHLSSRSKEKPVSRLVRSKSEQIPLLKKGDFGLHRLKKSGTFESTTPGSAHKKTFSAPPNAILTENSPSQVEATPGQEEVDKQAEAFIGKFYQQMRLQRLESLLRYKDRIDRSHR